MTTTTFPEQDNRSFSRLLLSKEVAEIIKQVVRESTPLVHPRCNDGKTTTGDLNA